jgi:hypothetical protein
MPPMSYEASGFCHDRTVEGFSTAVVPAPEAPKRVRPSGACRKWLYSGRTIYPMQFRLCVLMSTFNLARASANQDHMPSRYSVLYRDLGNPRLIHETRLRFGRTYVKYYMPPRSPTCHSQLKDAYPVRSYSTGHAVNNRIMARWHV